MFIIDDIITGVFNIGTAAVNSDAQRGAANKAIKLQNQQAFGSEQKTSLYLILLVGGAAVLTLTFLTIHVLRSAEEG